MGIFHRPLTKLFQLAPVLITSNPKKKAREEKFVTGRTVVLPCSKRVYEVWQVLYLMNDNCSDKRRDPKKRGESMVFCHTRGGRGVGWWSSMAMKNHTACPYQEPPDAVTHLNDLLGMNQTQDSLDKVSSDLTLPSSFSKSQVLILVLLVFFSHWVSSSGSTSSYTLRKPHSLPPQSCWPKKESCSCQTYLRTARPPANILHC